MAKNLSELFKAMNSIKSDIEELKQSRASNNPAKMSNNSENDLQPVESRYVELCREVLEHIRVLYEKNNAMEEKIDELDAYSMRNSLLFHGVMGLYSFLFVLFIIN